MNQSIMELFHRSSRGLKCSLVLGAMFALIGLTNSFAQSQIAGGGSFFSGPNPWIDVSTFQGVDCTGTNDSTLGVQSALNSMKSGYDLNIPAGCKLQILGYQDQIMAVQRYANSGIALPSSGQIHVPGAGYSVGDLFQVTTGTTTTTYYAVGQVTQVTAGAVQAYSVVFQGVGYGSLVTGLQTLALTGTGNNALQINIGSTFPSTTILTFSSSGSLPAGFVRGALVTVTGVNSDLSFDGIWPIAATSVTDPTTGGGNWIGINNDANGPASSPGHQPANAIQSAGVDPAHVGTGYAIGDTFAIGGGTVIATGVVDAVSGGGVVVTPPGFHISPQTLASSPIPPPIIGGGGVGYTAASQSTSVISCPGCSGLRIMVNTLTQAYAAVDLWSTTPSIGITCAAGTTGNSWSALGAGSPCIIETTASSAYPAYLLAVMPQTSNNLPAGGPMIRGVEFLDAETNNPQAMGGLALIDTQHFTLDTVSAIGFSCQGNAPEPLCGSGLLVDGFHPSGRGVVPQLFPPTYAQFGTIVNGNFLEDRYPVTTAARVDSIDFLGGNLSRAFHKYTNVLMIANKASLVAWYWAGGRCHAESKSL
jgi:hypothetical protein